MGLAESGGLGAILTLQSPVFHLHVEGKLPGVESPA